MRYKLSAKDRNPWTRESRKRRRQAAWFVVLILAAFIGGYLLGHVTGANEMRDRIYSALGYCILNIF